MINDVINAVIDELIIIDTSLASETFTINGFIDSQHVDFSFESVEYNGQLEKISVLVRIIEPIATAGELARKVIKAMQDIRKINNTDFRILKVKSTQAAQWASSTITRLAECFFYIEVYYIKNN